MKKKTKEYTREEFKELEGIFKIVVNNYEKLNQFYYIYSKYMKDGYPMPSTTCGNCDSSIGAYTQRLHAWYVSNSDKFES